MLQGQQYRVVINKDLDKTRAVKALSILFKQHWAGNSNDLVIESDKHLLVLKLWTSIVLQHLLTHGTATLTTSTLQHKGKLRVANLAVERNQQALQNTTCHLLDRLIYTCLDAIDQVLDELLKIRHVLWSKQDSWTLLTYHPLIDSQERGHDSIGRLGNVWDVVLRDSTHYKLA